MTDFKELNKIVSFVYSSAIWQHERLCPFRLEGTPKMVQKENGVEVEMDVWCSKGKVNDYKTVPGKNTKCNAKNCSYVEEFNEILLKRTREIMGLENLENNAE